MSHRTRALSLAFVTVGLLVAAGTTSRALAVPGVDAIQEVDEFAWQNEFSNIATTLADDYPATFSGSAIEDQASRLASVAFKGVPPNDVWKRFEQLNGVTVLVEGGRPASIEEMDRDLERLHRSVMAHPESVEQAVSTYDPASARFRMTVRPPATYRMNADALITSLRNSIEPALNERIDSIEVDPNLSAHGDAAYGGARLEVTGAGALECTAGFNVRHASGVTGFATAGHCNNTLTLENTNGASEFGTTYQEGHQGSWGDFQWSITGTSEPDDFYYNFSGIRDVSAIANPSQDQRLCRFGHKTGAHCAYVDDLSVCATYDGITHCRLVRMDRRNADGGDSGGPWYYGNTAYGFHAGSAGGLDAWSRATYIDDALSVYVRTG